MIRWNLSIPICRFNKQARSNSAARKLTRHRMKIWQEYTQQYLLAATFSSGSRQTSSASNVGPMLHPDKMQCNSSYGRREVHSVDSQDSHVGPDGSLLIQFPSGNHLLWERIEWSRHNLLYQTKLKRLSLSLDLDDSNSWNNVAIYRWACTNLHLRR